MSGLTKKLNRFLRYHECLEVFWHNYRTYHNNPNAREIPEESGYHKRPRGVILGAFIWSKTPQGERFWSRISDLWQTKIAIEEGKAYK